MSDSDPTLIVSGLGRCGLTMVATMLDAGGAPVAGDPPAYEPDLESVTFGGAVVKVVDPIGNELSGQFPEPGTCSWIWMLRDKKEQARSMAHMLEVTGQSVGYREIMKTIRPDTRAHLDWIDRRGEEVRRLRFGAAIKHPSWFAGAIADTAPFEVDPEAMQTVIDDRGPSHSGSLDKERSLIG